MNYKKLSLYVMLVSAVYLAINIYVESKNIKIFLFLFVFYSGVHFIIGSIYDKK